jgi:nucleoside-diphosphate-sugar epimerase
MKRVVITGGTGFVGANLVRRLLADGHEIHLLVRENYTSWRIEAIRQDVHLHEVNFVDGEILIHRMDEIRPDWVFHLATYGAYSYQTDLQRMVQTNVIGTMNLVEACVKTGFEAFINTGTSSEYGFKKHAPSETESLEPNSYYAVTKASATLFCRYTAHFRNVTLPTLRLYSVYGPYEEPTRLIPALILQGLKGQLPPLVNPNIARDYVYVQDVIDAYLLAATRPDQQPGAIYNVGTGIQTSLREVVELARGIMGIQDEPNWGSMPDRLWDSEVWVSDNEKIRNDLGWRPRCTIEQGLLLTSQWFRENPTMLNFYREQSLKGK